MTTTEVATTDSGGSNATSPLSTSAEIGIAIGCVALIAFLALVFYFKDRLRGAVNATDSAGIAGVFSDHQFTEEPAVVNFDNPAAKTRAAPADAV